MDKMKPPPSSVDIMLDMVRKDSTKMETLNRSTDVLKDLEQIASAAKEESDKQHRVYQAAFYNDRKIYRVAVYVLGALAIIAAIGAIFLTLYDSEIPESVVALGSASVGALVGLFADKPTS